MSNAPFIDHVRLENFRAFEVFEADLSTVTVIVGRNGVGKTSLLDGIATALWNLLPSAAPRIPSEPSPVRSAKQGNQMVTQFPATASVRRFGDELEWGVRIRDLLNIEPLRAKSAAAASSDDGTPLVLSFKSPRSIELGKISKQISSQIGEVATEWAVWQGCLTRSRRSLR